MKLLDTCTEKMLEQKHKILITGFFEVLQVTQFNKHFVLEWFLLK